MSEADKIIKNLKNSGKKVEEFYVSNKTSDNNVGSIEKISQTSDKNVANDSVIAHKFATMQQQIDKKDKRIQELEEENYVRKIQIYEKSIAKEKVIEAFEDIEDYFDRLNGPDEDMDYIRQVKQELLEGEK